MPTKREGSSPFPRTKPPTELGSFRCLGVVKEIKASNKTRDRIFPGEVVLVLCSDDSQSECGACFEPLLNNLACFRDRQST